MLFKKYSRKYAFDRGLNLLQQSKAGTANYEQRLIACKTSNRAISQSFYEALNLSPSEKADLNQTLVNKSVFDRHGNQRQTSSGQVFNWDYSNMLQTTATDLTEGQKFKEYNSYSSNGKRTRKVTEKTDVEGNICEITETLYLRNLEYRTTWQGENLSYDGQTVASHGTAINPWEKYVALRIHQGHKQVARKLCYTYKEGQPTKGTELQYSLDNNIDSCELTLNEAGRLKSYQSFLPYGETGVSLGNTKNQPYKYSGQEKESKLYNYGFRSLLSANFRWISPDPLGIDGSQLNWYAMVSGNPISLRDRMGLVVKTFDHRSNIAFLNAITKYAGPGFEFNGNNELQEPKEAKAIQGSTAFRQALIDIIKTNETLWLASTSEVTKFSWNYRKYETVDYNLKQVSGGAVTGTYASDEVNLNNYTKGDRLDTIVVIHPTYRASLKDEAGENLQTDTADLVMHEIYSHAFPLMFHRKKDTGENNGIKRENLIRKEMGMKERRLKTDDDYSHDALNPNQSSLMIYYDKNGEDRSIEDAYTVKEGQHQILDYQEDSCCHIL